MFKRNQIDDALVRAIDATFTRLDRPAILTRLKRLLDADRKAGPLQADQSIPAYAFYDSEAEGSGRDILFSGYSAWVLFIAYRLMSCGLPQGRAVYLMRHFRELLEREYERLTRMPVEHLLGIEGTVIATANSTGQEDAIAKGMIVERPEDMVFFCIHADLDVLGMVTRMRGNGSEAMPDNICRGVSELEKRLALDGFSNSPTLVIELMNPFVQLNYFLSRTTPARRGRRRGT